MTNSGNTYADNVEAVPLLALEAPYEGMRTRLLLCVTWIMCHRGPTVTQGVDCRSC